MRQRTLLSGIAISTLILAACAPAAPGATTVPVPPAATAAPAKPAQQAPSSKPAGQPAAKSDVSPELAKLIEGAKNETVLKGQWAESTFGGGAGWTEIVNAMNQRYGLNLQPQFTPGGPFDQMLSKISQEAAAGQPASSDVYLGSSGHIMSAIQAGNVLKQMDWNAILERPVPSDANMERVAPDGAAVATGTRIVGITYNTNLVKGDDIPTSIADPLDPKWQGRIATTPYATGFYDFASPDGLGYEYMKDYITKISAHAGGLMRCGETNRISSGEFAMLVFDCGGNDVIKLADEQGAPLGHARIKEVGRLNIIYLGVPVNSSSPNAAALLVNFMHTPEGQELYWKWDRIDLHIYPESHTYPMVKEITGNLIISSVQRDQSLASSGFDVDKVREEFVSIVTQGQ